MSAELMERYDFHAKPLPRDPYEHLDEGTHDSHGRYSLQGSSYLDEAE